MPDMVKAICLRAVRVSDDGIRNRLLEPGPDPVEVPASALAGLIAEGYVADPDRPKADHISAPAKPTEAGLDGGAATTKTPEELAAILQRGEVALNHTLESKAHAAASGLSVKHVGFGKWAVVDAAGKKLTEGSDKPTAEAELAKMLAGA